MGGGAEIGRGYHPCGRGLSLLRAAAHGAGSPSLRRRLCSAGAGRRAKGTRLVLWVLEKLQTGLRCGPGKEPPGLGGRIAARQHSEEGIEFRLRLPPSRLPPAPPASRQRLLLVEPDRCWGHSSDGACPARVGLTGRRVGQ